MATVSLHDTLRAGDRRALADYAAFLRRRFGPRLRLLRLFGSRPRGDGNEGCDLDVLAVVDALSPPERREIWEYTAHLLITHSAVVGCMAMSTAAWQDLRIRERRIITEIDRDAVDV